MNSVVMHHYWGSPGGGQLVCASAAYALEMAGMNPVLAGTFSFDPSSYVRWYGIDISKYRRYTFSIGPRAFGLLSRAFLWMPARKAIREAGAGFLFTDEETYEPIRKQFRDIKIAEYIHFPMAASLNVKYRSLGFYYKDDPYIYLRYGKFPLNMYWWLYRKAIGRYQSDDPFRSAETVMTNSSWTASVIKSLYGQEPYVVNPPLPPMVPINPDPLPFEQRENTIVMLGRFSEEKRYDWVVRELGPGLKGIRLVIFGGAVTPTQKSYMNSVIELAKASGLKVSLNEIGGDLSVVPNASRELINVTMDRAKAFLHATVNEHWGIAVAEAMARGLPIVVHRSGGAWTDLAEGGNNGIGYSDAGEALDEIIRLVKDPGIMKSYSERSIRRVSQITLENFSRKVIEIVKKL
ncbi:MAG: glycosyltransferase [Conexivisphaerales archaeon]